MDCRVARYLSRLMTAHAVANSEKHGFSAPYAHACEAILIYLPAKSHIASTKVYHKKPFLPT